MPTTFSKSSWRIYTSVTIEMFVTSQRRLTEQKGLAEQARELIESIDTSTLVGLRDRALIGVMTYTFARVSAVVSMRGEDYLAHGKSWGVRLHEKGGKRHEMPAHHKLEAFIDEYLRATGIGDAPKSPLFRSARGKTGELNGEAMHR